MTTRTTATRAAALASRVRVSDFFLVFYLCVRATKIVIFPDPLACEDSPTAYEILFRTARKNSFLSSVTSMKL